MPQASVAELDVVTSVKEKATTAYDMDSANKADPDDGVQQPAGPSLWSIEFYKQLFDVNTQQITDRIVNSMVPRSGQNYLEAFIKPKADLYGLIYNFDSEPDKFLTHTVFSGPFWICVTLVFTIAVSRNMASYLQFTEDKNYHWKYQFHTGTFSWTQINISKSPLICHFSVLKNSPN
jgi:hypothetical protein